jgi:hypothetical protein
MFIGDAKRMVEADTSYRNGKSDTANYILVNMVDNAKWLAENANAEPTDEQYKEVQSFILECSGIDLGTKGTKTLLSIYPRAKIKVAKYDVSDTDVRDDISFAVAHFFLGCAWPTYGDNVDIDAFVDLLKRQAVKVGFEVKSVSSQG